MSKVKCPCEECVPPDRQVGCHGWCEKYIAWHEGELKRTEEERRERYLTNQIVDMRMQCKNRSLKQHGRKKR